MLGFCTATGEIDLRTAPTLSVDLYETIALRRESRRW
jgi:hypothetical protein